MLAQCLGEMRRGGAWGELTYQGGAFKPGSTPTQTCHTPIGWRKLKTKKLMWASNKEKVVDDGTGTESYWITLLTDDYSAYLCAHAQTVLVGSEHLGAHPGIRLLTCFNPGLNYIQNFFKTNFVQASYPQSHDQCLQEGRADLSHTVLLHMIVENVAALARNHIFWSYRSI